MAARHTASTITDEALDDLYDQLAAAEQRADAGQAGRLRSCLVPGCRADVDIVAVLTGDRDRPSARGWRQIRPTVAGGCVCPAHAPLVAEHRHTWCRSAHTACLVCSCGWSSPAARWSGYAVAAWREHLLLAIEANG